MESRDIAIPHPSALAGCHLPLGGRHGRSRASALNDNLSALDRANPACYNISDNLITQCVASFGALTGDAEQDNRVKIPDGTAAVSANGSLLG